MSEIICYAALAGVAIFIVSGLILWIAKFWGKKLSIYKVFGIVDVIFGLVVLVIAIVDFKTPGGDLNGLLGTLLLLIFEPAVIIFLVIDVLLYIKWSKRVNGK